MTLSGVVEIEPFLSKKGVGFALVYSDGTLKMIEEGEWNQIDSFDDNERKDLTIRSKTVQWRLPNKPDLSKITKKFDIHVIASPDPKTESDKEYFMSEWVEFILKDIHDRIVKFAKMMVYFDDERVYSLIANTVIASYFREQFSHLPLIVFSATSSAGKTTALKVFEHLAYHGKIRGSYTAASIRDDVHYHGLTMLLDESLNNIRPETDKGQDLINLLLTGWAKSEANSSRMNQKGGIVEHRQYFTNYIMTVRGDELNEDLRSRSITTFMSIPDGSFIPEDIEHLEDVVFPSEDIRPENIRTELYALKIMTEIERRRGYREKGIYFNSFHKEAHNDFNVVDHDTGRYMYAIKNSLFTSKRMIGRILDLFYTYYTIGLATQSAGSMLTLIIDNNNVFAERQKESLEAVLFTTLCDIIIEDWKEKHATLEGYQIEIIEREEFNRIVSKITTKRINDAYRERRINIDGYQPHDIENAKTITARFRNLNLPYNEGAGRLNYLRPDDYKFRKNFRRAMTLYGDSKILDFFTNIKG